MDLQPNSVTQSVSEILAEPSIGDRLSSNGIDDDGDLVVDEFGEGLGVTRGPGSPLSPRLPLDVAIRFTLFFPSPYVGAPDFVRTFDERIDLPTGFIRGQ